MRLTKEELIEKFKNYAGEDVTSDAAIELLEDISDSIEVEKERQKKEKEKIGKQNIRVRRIVAQNTLSVSEPGDKEKEPEEEKEEEEEETEETEEERAENVTYEDLFEEKKKKED